MWVPYPHQVPPDSDWRFWLLEGGRGSGKTDGAAYWLDRHVSGPACLPRLRGGHRVGIIGPTLGDTIESCVNGPSGLRAHNPRLVLRQVAGGSFVRWPNGAEGKIFGAFTPQDVERLRAGGNRCLAGDTLVKTPFGDVPIRDVRAGDYVVTRNGYRRVLRSGVTRPTARLWRLETEVGSVYLTADHEVHTPHGWCEAQFLTPDDTITAWSTLSPTTVCGSTRCGVGTSSRADAVSSTATCGSSSGDPSQPGTTYTTATATTRRQPTRFGSSSSNGDRTGERTRDCESGTLRGVEPPPSFREPGLCAGAGVAEVSFSGYQLTTAVTCATPPRHERDGCASCAVASLPPGVDPQQHAHVRVLRCSPTDRVEPVYDVMVEHDHEFFADGILVSNCAVWAEELAAWVQLKQAWDQMRFGLRLGPKPRAVISTTPKPRKEYLEIRALADLVRTGASTSANENLDPTVRADLYETYGGTRLGRQELDAEILTDVPGALWTNAMLEDRRPPPDTRVRCVVPVDPSGGKDPQNNEQGIGVVCTGPDGRGYVLADRTCKLSPDGWGRRAVQAYLDFGADAIVVERNYGGDMVRAVIATAVAAMRSEGVEGLGSVRVIDVTASRGKAVRAAPVAALYEQGRVSHCGVFAELESELTSWTPESGTSPNRLDWLVWGLTHLMVSGRRIPAYVG